MSCACRFVGLLLLVASAARAQTLPVPKPFPQPGQQPPPTQTPVKPASPTPAPPGTPTRETLGVEVFPSAEFLTSYDAGQGQRYYLFGTNVAFADVVAWYKILLRDKGELVFDEPPVHQFDIGKFREDTMAFPPSVTIKDYTWGGMEGYLNPKLGATPARFKTIIQIVPPPKV
jgi:hypothetical protein